MHAVISAVGSYVPDGTINNAQIEEWTGREAGWIKHRTGIEQRHWAEAEVPTSGLAYLAVLDMLNRSHGALRGVSAIILATSTPDQPQPAAASHLQRRLGLSGVPAFDLNAVCAGWPFALRVAEGLLRTQPGKVLLVAADKYSPILNRADPTTVSLFGDGAAATLIELGSDPRTGLLSLELATHGEFADMVTVPAGGSAHPTSTDPGQYLFQMKGKEVRKYVVENLPTVLYRACEKARVGIEQIGAFICHQANVRLLEELANLLDVDPSLFVLTAPENGNIGAASLPFTFAAAHKGGLLVPGRPVALCGVGGGMGLAAGIYVP